MGQDVVLIEAGASVIPVRIFLSVLESVSKYTSLNPVSPANWIAISMAFASASSTARLAGTLLLRGVDRNNYLGGPGCNRDILRRWFFGPLYGYFISRLIWIGYEIRTLNFILFVDSEFIYLFTWSWITVYPFRFNSWTFGGMLIRHWSIKICFYRSPKFWMTNIFFVKECINYLSFAHYLTPNFNPPPPKKINTTNDKLTWEREIINYHIKFILTWIII